MRTLVQNNVGETEIDRILAARGVRRIARFAPGPGGGKSSTFPQLLETLEDRIPGVRTVAVAGCGGTAAPPRIAEGLATAAAREGRRTVIVDADLSEPRQHLLWNGPDAAVGPGVRQILEGGLPASPDAFHPTRIANMRLVPAGSPGLRDISELLSGKVLERWMQVHLPAMAESVVVSIPRIEETSAPSVARHADALLVVIDPDRCDPIALEGGLERLAAAGVVVAGVVTVPTGGESVASPIPHREHAATTERPDFRIEGETKSLEKDNAMNADANDNAHDSETVPLGGANPPAPRAASGVDDLSDLLGNWRRREYAVAESRSRSTGDTADRPFAEPAWNPLPTEMPATAETSPQSEPEAEPMPSMVAEAIARIDATDTFSDRPEPMQHVASEEAPVAMPVIVAYPESPAEFETEAEVVKPEEETGGISFESEPAPTFDAPVPVPQAMEEPVIETPLREKWESRGDEAIALTAQPVETYSSEPIAASPAPLRESTPPLAAAAAPEPAFAGSVSLPASFEWAAGEPGRVALKVEALIPSGNGAAVAVAAELSVAADRLRSMKGTAPGGKVVLDADVAAGGDDSRLRLWTGAERTLALDVAFEAGSGFRFQSGSGADAPRVSFEAGVDGRSTFRATSSLLHAELSRTPGTAGDTAAWSFQLTVAPAA